VIIPDDLSDAAILKAIKVIGCGWTVANVRSPCRDDSYHKAIINVAIFCQKVDAAAKLADAEIAVEGLERHPGTSDATARRALAGIMVDGQERSLGEGIITTSSGWLDVNELVAALKAKGILDA